MSATVTVSLGMADGGQLDFAVRQNPDLPILFALGVRKSGSSLMNLILLDLAEANGWPVVLLPDKAFAAGYRYPDWNGNPDLFRILRRGNLYAGFRDAPSGLFGRPAFKDARKVLLVRDPRDALVSEYFSSAFSHQLPEQRAEGSLIAKRREEALQQSVEDYVLKQAKQLNRTIDAYRPLLADPNLKLFRYEEVIFDKAAWIAELAAWFGWQAPPDVVARILAERDILPEAEEPTAFVRKVVPGDHREKLSADGLRRLNAQLSPTWGRLGY
ncbi:sulfotransferase domain-containing protein [Sphingomonas sp.]|uniref:sulfotransferase domain-containing protein n=1 Tax=Sphingomonas sp. TaxID=28214 RepID=UPI0035C842F0